MSRTGKIARLPREVREQLNRRLQDGEPGIRLVEWLNTLPETQKALAVGFEGRAISEQNLSEWKQGGFRDWERHDESCQQVRRLTERAWDLDEAAEGDEISNRLASVLAAELAGVAGQLLEECSDPKERWPRLREVLVQLEHLRQQDYNARRVRIQQERWNEEQEQREQQEHEDEMKKSKDCMLARVWAPLTEEPLAKLFGGGEYGKKMASLITAIKNDLPLPDLKVPGRSAPAEPAQANPTESDQIRPNQTNSVGA